MRTTLMVAAILFCFAACRQTMDQKPVVIALTYQQTDIQRQFDTLFNYQQSMPNVYTGMMEQALANCHDRNPADSITQDVLSSMYLNNTTHVYDCVTTTVFSFADGTITAMGVFNMIPGSNIAPDHNFPITGGSGAYEHVYGTYTRKYRDSVYHVELKYFKR